MTITYFPFDDADVYEAQWKKMARLWRDTGVVPEGDQLEAYGDSSGMQVKVKSGMAFMEGFFVESSAEETVALSSAHATLDRIDRIILKVNWTSNTITLEALTGTPAGSPSAPSLTQSTTVWEISLAQVYVAAAAVTIDSGDVTDERTLSTGGGLDFLTMQVFM